MAFVEGRKERVTVHAVQGSGGPVENLLQTEGAVTRRGGDLLEQGADGPRFAQMLFNWMLAVSLPRRNSQPLSWAKRAQGGRSPTSGRA